MKKLPDGWEEVELLRYLELVKSGVNKFSGLKKYIATGSLETGKIIDFIEIDYETRPSRANMEVQLNDVLFAKMKDTEKVFLVSENEKKFLFSTGFSVLRVKNYEKVFPAYIFYWLKSSNFQKKKNEECSGATQKAINETRFIKFKLIIPPLPTQKKIAATLEKAEKLQEWRREADGLTDEFLKNTFLEMFGDPINNPKKWGKRPLKEFGKVMTGNTPPRMNSEYYGNYIEWIKSDNINTPYTYLTKSEEMLSEAGAGIGRIVPKGSVLVTCIAGSLSCIGNVAIADRQVAFNQQINAIVPNKEVNEFFLYHLILITKEYIQNFSTQSMKGMLNKGIFESIPFIFPPTDLQNKFGLIANDVEEVRRYQQHSKQYIDDFFNVLMQKSFKGEMVI